MTWRAWRSGLTKAVPIGVLGGATMWATALLAEPMSTPPTVDAAFVSATWWVLAALTMWLTFSVFVIGAELAHDSIGPSRFERFAMPGSRGIAKAMLAVGVMAASACSADSGDAPRLYAIDAPVGALDVEPATEPLNAAGGPVGAAGEGSAARQYGPVVGEEAPPARLFIDEPRIEIDLTPPAPTEEVAPANSTSATYEVESGDNLWTIAQRHVEATNPNATTAEIAGYWRALIASNETTLWSGEPNMIHPGEVLSLPST